MEKIATEFGSHSLKTDLYPSFDEESGGFEKFMSWAVKSKSFEFVRKQVNTKPFREFLLEHGKCPIGLKSYTKAKINSRISASYKNKIKEA